MATKQEEALSLFELVSAKLFDAQKRMAEARDLLKQDLNNGTRIHSPYCKLYGLWLMLLQRFSFSTSRLLKKVKTGPSSTLIYIYLVSRNHIQLTR